MKKSQLPKYTQPSCSIHPYVNKMFKMDHLNIGNCSKQSPQEM